MGKFWKCSIWSCPDIPTVMNHGSGLTQNNDSCSRIWHRQGRSGVYLCYSSAQAQPSWSRSVTFKTKNVQTASGQRLNIPLLLHSRCYQSILWGLELRVETFDKWFYLRREGLCSFLQISNASSLISSMFRVWKCPIVLKVKSKNTEAEYCLVLKISFDWIFAGKKSLKVAERRLK